MDGYLPGNECAICKGRCCRERGCSLSPEDMLLALRRQSNNSALYDKEGGLEYEEWKAELIELLNREDGLYAIDSFYTKNGSLYYLRMRHKCYTFIGIDAIGECIALTETGCSLSEVNRPKGGRYLQSDPSMHCRQLYDQNMMIEDWRPYQAVLKEIWDEYEPAMQADGTFDRCDEAYFAWMKQQREKQSK